MRHGFYLPTFLSFPLAQGFIATLSCAHQPRMPNMRHINFRAPLPTFARRAATRIVQLLAGALLGGITIAASRALGLA